MTEARYRSPFDNRYGSDEMRAIWADRQRGLRVRDIWIAQAAVQASVGLVSREGLEDLVEHRDDIDPDEINSREFDVNNPKYTGHDVLAALSEFADKALIGGGFLHQANTSEDTLSNEEMVAISRSLKLVEQRLAQVLGSFAIRIRDLKDLVCMAYTHGQAAEPTTMGYRLAVYAQDFLADLNCVRFLRENIKGKGIKGAVGTYAPQLQLLEGTGMDPREHEARIMDELGVKPATITGQTYPRKFTFLTVTTLASIGQSAHKFAGDVKLLQQSPYGEVSEPRAKNDKSSSAMLHKRNPRHSENIKSLSRGLAGKVVEAWITASEVTLERGIEDSAGKRSYLPESFFIVDEILRRTDRVVSGLEMRETAIGRNLKSYGPFIALEPVLTALSKKGANRLEMDGILRIYAASSIEAVEAGRSNPLKKFVMSDPNIGRYLSDREISKLFRGVYHHVGLAPEICVDFLEKELYPAIS